MPYEYDNSVFVLKFLADGELAWARVYGGGADVNESAFIAAANGALYLSGTARDSAEIDGTDIGVDNGEQSFILKLDENGSPAWLLTGSGDNREQHYSGTGGLALSDNGQLLASGSFIGELSYGGPPVQSNDKLTIFLAAFDAENGEALWVKTARSTDSNPAIGVIGISNGDEDVVRMYAMFSDSDTLIANADSFSTKKQHAIARFDYFPNGDLKSSRLIVEGDLIWPRVLTQGPNRQDWIVGEFLGELTSKTGFGSAIPV